MLRSNVVWLCVALIGFAFLGGATCATAQIVALGASNTASEYPAELEKMLRAKGQNVHVANAGVSGDTTGGMLARLDSAVPSGTRVVILQPGANDRRRGEASSTAEIVARLQQRGIKVVMLGNAMIGAIPPQFHRPDRIHLTPEGYRLLAAAVLPRVLAALR